MTPDEFWNMTPHLFFLKEKGYFRRENRAGYYFRELWALEANIYRKDGTPAIEGADVLTLPGEKVAKKEKPVKRLILTDSEIKRIESLYNKPSLILP